MFKVSSNSYFFKNNMTHRAKNETERLLMFEAFFLF